MNEGFMLVSPKSHHTYSILSDVSWKELTFRSWFVISLQQICPSLFSPIVLDFAVSIPGKMVPEIYTEISFLAQRFIDSFIDCVIVVQMMGAIAPVFFKGPNIGSLIYFLRQG